MNRIQTTLGLLLLVYVLWFRRAESALTVQQVEHLKTRLGEVKAKVDAVKLVVIQTTQTLNTAAKKGLPQVPDVVEPTPPLVDNIAEDKPAFQTSVVWGMVAGLAVDGNTNTDYFQNSCQHNQRETNPMWWVDLGQSFTIDRVVIFNRQDYDPERINPFNIHIGDSYQVTLNPKCGGDHHIAVNQPSISVSCRGMTGRYVGVRLPGYYRTLTLCEVQVFAVSKQIHGGMEPPSWSASSEWGSRCSADRADVNTRETADAAGAWIAATNDQDQWLMRDLGDVSVITGVITKGRNYSPDWPHGIHDQYVTSYTISYGNENGDETFYTDADGQVTVFPANDDRDTQVYNDFVDFSGRITARFVKIHPQTWHGHISMRAKIVTDG
ncbi:uncharacterized protein LOC144909059 [Branchiostoma floridae x Branchiostoma belcheri]